MSTPIRISEDTKQKLEAIKREEESFDELLARLARTDKDVEEMAGFGPDGIDEEMAAARQRARDDWENRVEN